MAQALLCPQCGKTVPADAPQALCPACLMQVGLESGAASTAREQGAGTQPPMPTAVFDVDSARSGPIVVAPERDKPAIPGYTILGELGRGGMGVVYKARHVALGRLVALKMILAGSHAGATEIARFRTEAEAIARLKHENIIQIYEVGEHEGKPYFSLEYCGGGSLAQKINGTPLQPREAARMVESLARGIEAAHREDIIHRDLKPGNVLFLKDGTPKITDFGLAKKLDDAGQTQTGAVMGTPSYMSPEQAGGRTKKLGPPADIYALGAILYELLTGRPPFKAATPLDTILQVVADEPVPPSQLQHKTPADLETICLKCLHKDPRRRYPSAKALADDLRRYQRGEPITARPVSVVERTVKLVKRRPGISVLLTAIALLLIMSFVGVSSGFGWALFERSHAINEKDLADKARKEAEKKTEAELQIGYYARISLAEIELKEQMLFRVEELLEECQPRFRGWEWHYLKGYGKRFAAKGHDKLIVGVAFSPDSQFVATASGDQTVRVWNALTGKEASVFRGHKESVHCVVFSPDGKLIASGAANYKDPDIKHGGEVLIWNIKTHEVQKRLTGPQGPINRVAWSADGKLIAGGSFDGSVHVWDAANGRTVHKFTAHTKPIWGCAFSPDGNHLATASFDLTVRVWDLATGREAFDAMRLPQQPWHVVYSPDGKRLAVPCMGTTSVTIFEAATGKKLVEHNTHLNFRVAFSDDGKRLATSGWDRSVKIWDADSGREIMTLRGARDGLIDVAFSPNGRRIAAVGDDRMLHLWDASPPDKIQDVTVLKGHAGPVMNLALSSDGKLLASISRDQGKEPVTKIWKAVKNGTSSFQPLGTLQTQKRAAAHKFDFAPGGKELISLDDDGTLAFWDPLTGDNLRRFKANLADPTVPGALGVSLDGKLLAVGSGTFPHAVKLFDAATGKNIRDLGEHGNVLWCLTFSPPEQARLATASQDHKVGIWSLDRKEKDRLLEGHTGAVWSVAFSPDGKQLASSSSDETVILWDPASGEKLHHLKGHTDRVFKVAYRSDGKRLASCGADNVVIIWDPKTGDRLYPLRGHSSGVGCVLFTPDNRYVISAGGYRGTGEIRIWDLEKIEDKLRKAGELK